MQTSDVKTVTIGYKPKRLCC